ncbi:MAG: flagellar brake protein [Desulfobacula sp.]|nr:flagellar brake protein [Desulfobacula sp.]
MAKTNHHPIDFSQRLFIELGTALLIETGKKALSSKLIGMKVGAYLIVDVSGAEPDTADLSTEEMIQVRYVNQDDIFRFSSRILMTLDQPDHLIFLHYPDKVESCNVRSHKRVDCFMQIHVKSEGRRDPAVITNISAKGCLCSMDRFPSWEKISGRKVELLFPYGDSELLTLPGEVKSTQIQGTQIKLGVQFIEMEGYSRSVLSTLVPAMRF